MVSFVKISFSGDDMKNSKNLFGPALRSHRISQNLSQAQLAAKMQTAGIEITQSMISQIEKGTRGITDFELVCLSKILNVTLSDMLQDLQIYDTK